MLNPYILFEQKTNKNPTLQEEYVMEEVRLLVQGNATKNPTPGHRATENQPHLTGRHFPRTIHHVPCVQPHKTRKKT